MSSRVGSERRYRPPPGRGPRRQQLCRTRKEVTGRYYQLLSGHVATGSYFRGKIQTDSDKCWWCGSGERQSRHHLFARC